MFEAIVGTEDFNSFELWTEEEKNTWIRCAAIHETGHLVVALALGVDVGRVAITPSHANSMMPKNGPWGKTWTKPPLDPRYFYQEAVICCGGFAAEIMLRKSIGDSFQIDAPNVIFYLRMFLLSQIFLNEYLSPADKRSKVASRLLLWMNPPCPDDITNQLSDIISHQLDTVINAALETIKTNEGIVMQTANRLEYQGILNREEIEALKPHIVSYQL